MATKAPSAEFARMTLPAALKHVRPLLAVLVAAGLVAGFAVKLAGLGAWSDVIRAVVTVPVLLALVTEIASSLWRDDVDIVAHHRACRGRAAAGSDGRGGHLQCAAGVARVRGRP